MGKRLRSTRARRYAQEIDTNFDFRLESAEVRRTSRLPKFDGETDQGLTPREGTVNLATPNAKNLAGAGRGDGGLRPESRGAARADGVLQKTATCAHRLSRHLRQVPGDFGEPPRRGVCARPPELLEHFAAEAMRACGLPAWRATAEGRGVHDAHERPGAELRAASCSAMRSPVPQLSGESRCGKGQERVQHRRAPEGGMHRALLLARPPAFRRRDRKRRRLGPPEPLPLDGAPARRAACAGAPFPGRRASASA